MNIVERVHAMKTRLVVSHDYLWAKGYPHRASTDLREMAMTFAMGMSSPKKIAEAAPLYIEPEMLKLVQHAAQSLPTTAFRCTMLPSSLGMVVSDIPLFHHTGYGDILVGQWYWNAAEACMNYVSWRDLKGEPLHAPVPMVPLWPVLAGSLPEGVEPNNCEITQYRTGDSTAFDDHVYLTTFLITLWLMLGQRIAVQEHAVPNRVLRKRMEKDGAALTASGVQIIRLRRPSVHGGGEATQSPTDWTHRWMVDGHWRNQYLPSTDGHRPTWIAPYIKGPDDKPLVLKERIYTFVR